MKGFTTKASRFVGFLMNCNMQGSCLFFCFGTSFTFLSRLCFKIEVKSFQSITGLLCFTKPESLSLTNG